MNKLSFWGLLLLAALPLTGWGQQATSGKIDYNMTFQGRSGGRQSDNPPREFTMKNELAFNATSGKWGAIKSGNNGGGRFGTTYLNFSQKAFLRAFKRRGNDTTFLISTPFKEAENFQLTGKTKTLLGYNCQEATATLRNSKITFWFTKDLPLTFAPMNGLLPPGGGVVLEVQNRRMHAVATAVDLGPVDAGQLSLPEPNRPISQDEMRHRYQQRRRAGGGDRQPPVRRNHNRQRSL